MALPLYLSGSVIVSPTIRPLSAPSPRISMMSGRGLSPPGRPEPAPGAVFLVGPEGGVCGVLGVSDAKTDADAGVCVNLSILPLLRHHGPGQKLPHGLGLGGRVRPENDEFITMYVVTIAGHLGNGFADGPKHHIPELMAVGVVDGLEVVRIEKRVHGLAAVDVGQVFQIGPFVFQARLLAGQKGPSPVSYTHL